MENKKILIRILESNIFRIFDLGPDPDPTFDLKTDKEGQQNMAKKLHFWNNAFILYKYGSLK